MKKKIFIVLTALFIVTQVVSPLSTFAVEAPPDPPGDIEGEVNIGEWFRLNFRGLSSPTSLGGFVSSLIGQIYIIGLIFDVIYLTWGSYRYLISGGDAKAAKAARDHMTYAVVGMVVIFMAYGIFILLNNQLFNRVFTSAS
jgi:hypothetical protein